MGNQSMQQAMSVLETEGPQMDQQLNQLERDLWTSTSSDAVQANLNQFFTSLHAMVMKNRKQDEHLNEEDFLQTLFDYHSALSAKKSGLGTDEQRWADTVRECMQIGFLTKEKKIEVVKQGEYKKILIPNDQTAIQFERSMQVKLLAMLAIFYAKQQPQTAKADLRKALKLILGPLTVKAQTELFRSKQLIDGFTSQDQKTKQMLIQQVINSLSENPDYPAWTLPDTESLHKENQRRVFRQVLASEIERIMAQSTVQPSSDALDSLVMIDTSANRTQIETSVASGGNYVGQIVKYLLLTGTKQGDPHGILLASRLQEQHKVDIRPLLEHFVRQSDIDKDEQFESLTNRRLEVGVNTKSDLRLSCLLEDSNRATGIVFPEQRSFKMVDLELVEDYGGDDQEASRFNLQTKLVTLGSYWFLFKMKDQRRAKVYKCPKGSDSGNFEPSIMKLTGNYPSSQLFVHKGRLLLRYRFSNDLMLFGEIDPKTMSVCKDTHFTMAECSRSQAHDLMQADRQDDIDSRWARHVALCSDDQYIYAMVMLKEREENKVAKTAVKVYELCEAGRKKNQLRFIKDIVLYNGEGQEHFLGPQIYDSTYLWKGQAYTNGQHLVWFYEREPHVFDLRTGFRVLNEPNLRKANSVCTFDPQSNYFYEIHMSRGSEIQYRFKLAGFYARSEITPSIQAKERRSVLPRLKDLMQDQKQYLEQSIQKEKGLEEDCIRACIYKAGDSIVDDIFDNPSLEPQKPLHLFSEGYGKLGLQHCDTHTFTKALILQHLGLSALKASQKANAHSELPQTERQNVEKLYEIFNDQVAVNCTRSYFSLVRQTLDECINVVQEAKNEPSEMVERLNKLNVINMAYVMIANLESSQACDIDLITLCSEEEIHQIATVTIPSLRILSDQALPSHLEECKDDLQQNTGNVLREHLEEATGQLLTLLLTYEQFYDPIDKVDTLQALITTFIRDLTIGNAITASFLNQLESLSDSAQLKILFDSSDPKVFEKLKLVYSQCLSGLASLTTGAITAWVSRQESSDGFQSYAPLRMLTSHLLKHLCEVYGQSLLIVGKKKAGLRQEGIQIQKEYKSENQELQRLEQFFIEVYEQVCENLDSVLSAFMAKGVELSKIREPFSLLYDQELQGLQHFAMSQVFGEQSPAAFSLQFSLLLCVQDSCQSRLVKACDIFGKLLQTLSGARASLRTLITVDSERNWEQICAEQNTYRQRLETTIREVLYAVGVLAHRLMHVPEETKKDSLCKLNILQGGIEPRFIPTVGPKTKEKIKQCFEALGEFRLAKLADSEPSATEKLLEDVSLTSVIDGESISPAIELTLTVLQQGLLTRIPMCPYARLGAPHGEKLTRAAFAVLVKFSLSQESFFALCEQVQTAGNLISDEKLDQKGRKIAQKLKASGNETYLELLKLWDKAALMRKWTQKLKLVVSERNGPEIQRKMENEYHLRGRQLDIDLDEEAREQFENRVNEKTDSDVESAYLEVIAKANFLVRLAVPQIFIDAKKQEVEQKRLEKEASQATAVEESKEPIPRSSMRKSVVDLMTQKASDLAARASRAFILLPDGQRMHRKTLRNFDDQYGHPRALIRESIVGGKEGEKLDWRARLRQWKSDQMAQRAVTDMSDRSLESLKDCTFSVLGCLQAEFTCADLENSAETTLEAGMSRAVGLKMLAQGLEEYVPLSGTFDLIQWLQGALRRNRVSGGVHYLNGLEGCDESVRACMRSQFARIISAIVLLIKHEQVYTYKYVYLLNALCWSFRAEDHKWMAELEIFKALLVGDGAMTHPLRSQWGATDLLYGARAEATEFCLPHFLFQTFNFLVMNTLDAIFNRDGALAIQEGIETTDNKMLSGLEAHNQSASETMLNQISQVIFATLDRFAKMSLIWPSNELLQPKRFPQPGESPRERSNYESLDYKCEFMADVKEYFKQQQGEQQALNHSQEKREQAENKVNKLIRILHTNPDHCSKAENATNAIEPVFHKIAKKAGESVLETMEALFSRKNWAIQLVKDMSMAELGLQEHLWRPSIDDRSQSIGITRGAAGMSESTTQGFDLMTSTDQGFRQTSEGRESMATCQDGIQSEAYETVQWTCSLCSLLNSYERQECQLCQTPMPEQQDLDPVSVDEDGLSDGEDKPSQKNERIVLRVPTDSCRTKQIREEESRLRQLTDPNALLDGFRKNLQRDLALNEQVRIGDNEDVKLFSEIAMLRIAGLLDTMIGFVDEATEGFQIVSDLSHPINLSQIISVSVRSSNQLQVLMQRLLQSLIKLETPDESFEEAIQIVQQGRDETVSSILASDSGIKVRESQFLQLLCNRVALGYESLQYRKEEGNGEVCKTQQILTTLKTVYQEGRKHPRMRQVFKQALQKGLLRVKESSDFELFVLMNLLPETQINSLCFGTSAITTDGEMMQVLGAIPNDKSENNPEEDLAYQVNDGQLQLKCLYFDPANPEKQEIVTKLSSEVQPTADLDAMVAEDLFKASLIFSDPNICRGLFETAFPPAGAKQPQLLQMFFIRGVTKMLQTCPEVFSEFMVQNDFMGSFVNELQRLMLLTKKVTSEQFRELKLDMALQEACRSDQICLLDKVGPSLVSAGGLSLVIDASWKANELTVRAADHSFYTFKFRSVVGDKNEKVINQLRQRSFEVFTSKQLTAPDLRLLKKLRSTQVVLTDNEQSLFQIVRRLKTEFTRRANQSVVGSARESSSCLPHTFIFVENLEQLQQVLSVGSKVQNTDKTSRGYLLSQIMKQTDPQIWMKIPEEFFLEKFMKLSPQISNQALVEGEALELLLKLVEANYDSKPNHKRALMTLVQKAFQQIKADLVRPARFSTDLRKNSTGAIRKIDLTYPEFAGQAKGLSRTVFDPFVEKFGTEAVHEKVKLTFFADDYGERKVWPAEERNKIVFEAINKTKITKEDFVILVDETIQGMAFDVMYALVSKTPAAIYSALIDKTENHLRLFSAIHDQLTARIALAWQGGRFQTQHLEKTKGEIKQFLTYLRTQGGARLEQFFEDFCSRADLLLQTLSPHGLQKDLCDVKQMGQYELNVRSLCIWREIIFEQIQVPHRRAAMVKVFFDLLMCAAIGLSVQIIRNGSMEKRLNLTHTQSELLADVTKLLKRELRECLETMKAEESRTKNLKAILNCKMINHFFGQNNQEFELLLSKGGSQVLQIFMELQNVAILCPQVEMSIQQSIQVSQAVEVLKIIDEGTSSASFLTQAKLQAILRSKDAPKVKDLATYYATTAPMNPHTRFKATVGPYESDRQLVVNMHTSKKLLQVRLDDGSRALINKATLASGGNGVIDIPQGAQATVEFPCDGTQVLYTGRLKLRGNYRENCLDSYDWVPHDASENKLQAAKVHAAGNAMMLLTNDEQVWGMGREVQGDDGRLVKLSLPDQCRQFSKAVQTQAFRLILTRYGDLFFSGLNRDSLFGFSLSLKECIKKFQALPKHAVSENDKVKDICGGKDFFLASTQSGKLIAKGTRLFEDLSAGRSADCNNEYLAFGLTLPLGYIKVSHVFAAQNIRNIWVTLETPTGLRKTFGGGQSREMVGNGANNDANNSKKLEPLDLPDGLYMTELVCWQRNAFGVDNQGDLWIWGTHLGLQSDTSFFDEANSHANSSKPLRVRWISEMGFKVVEIKCGKIVTILKVQNAAGHCKLIALFDKKWGNEPGGEGKLKYQRLVGLESYESSFYEDTAVILSTDTSSLHDFACSKTASIMIQDRAAQSQQSMILDNPDYSGMVHFYRARKSQGGQVMVLDETAFGIASQQVPEVVFATRQPIKHVIDVLRDENQTQQSIEWNLPDLESLDLTFDEDAEGPVYYSHFMINRKVELIQATESEAVQGGMPWDMNPLLFYRCRKPLRSPESLPVINIDQFYATYRNEEELGQIAFTLLKKGIQSEELEHVEVSDPATMLTLEQTKNMTKSQDRDLLNELDKQLLARVGAKYELSQLQPSKFDLSPAKFAEYASLNHLQGAQIEMRADLLLKLSKAFSQAFKFIDVKNRHHVNSIAWKHFQLKTSVLPSVVNTFIDSEMAKVSNGGQVVIRIDRMKAQNFVEEGKCDTTGKFTIFGQIINELRQENREMSYFRIKNGNDRPLKISLTGENSIDVGGPFRDALTDSIAELESSILPLLIETPNRRQLAGPSRDCWMFNPSSDTPTNLEMFRYLGGFIAFGILSKQPFALSLAPFVWKQILGETIELADLQSIDIASAKLLQDLQAEKDSPFCEKFEYLVECQMFTTVLSNSQEFVLCEGGEEKQVTKDNVDEFVRLTLAARVAECDKQIKAVREGIDSVLQGKIASAQYMTAEAIEARVCGEKFIDAEILKSISTYPNCGAQNEHIKRFWRVFDGFTQTQRGLYLKFVWGRTRLPVVVTGITHKVKLMNGWKDDKLPESHTCFFVLDLPPYKTDEACREKFLQACQMCGQIDND